MNARHYPFVFIGGTSEPGGLHVHTADVAMAIARTGRAVTIICPSVDHFTAMFADSDVRVEVIPPQTANTHAAAYWRNALARHGNAIAVLCRGKLGESSVADLWHIRRATRRLFTIEHRALDANRPPRRLLRRHGWAMRALVRRVLVVSEEVAQHARMEFGLPRAQVATCINWYDPVFQPVSEAQRRAAKQQLGIAPDTLVVGYHGRLAPEKRVDALIDAFASVRAPAGVEVRLVLVGEGWKRRELEERIRAKQLEPRVQITGWHPNPRAALAAFDISVLPSLSEGFPLGLLEAMATGAACLAHPMSSTHQIINSGQNGVLADLQDAAAFRDALQQLVLLSDEQRTILGRAAAATIARDYSRERRLPAVLEALDIVADPNELPTRNRTLAFVR